MRIACARVADLPLAAELRAHPELRGRPLAITDGAAARAEVLCVSREAARVGVRAGATAAHARSLCTGLAVRTASPALEHAARDALLDAAFSCAPRAALAPPAGGAFATEAAVFADAGGTDALFRSEAGFATALVERIRTLGLTADVAVASSRGLARIAVRQLAATDTLSGREEARPEAGGRVLALTPKRERAFLAALPIDLLDPGDALAEALTRFGVRTVGDLLALPRRGLATRLGADALAWVRIVGGEAVEAPLPEAREHHLVEAIDLEAPEDRLEPLLFVLQGLLSRLIERLALRHLACGDLALTFDLADGARDARRIGVAAPCSDLRVLVRLARHALEARALAAPIAGVAVATRASVLRRDQLDLFRPAGPAPAVLGETLAALQSLCGDARVGAPVAVDTHHPDSFAVAPFAPQVSRSPQAREAGAQRGEAERSVGPRKGGKPSEDHQAGARGDSGRGGPAGTLALRALRPPLPAQVRQSRQCPVWIRSAIANGRVVHCAGPWRTTGGWWSSEERFAFDQFDVQSEDGVVVRLRFDHVRREWQIDAVYD
jgi:protein ImuB